MKRFDVIVLGGGIIGCALADELARRGERVVVLERGSVGAEASGAAAGILASQMDLPRPGPFFELCQAARRLYPRWVAHLERRSGLSVEYRKDGILYLAQTIASEQAMIAQARWQRKVGARIERWSPQEARRFEPAIDGRFRSAFRFPMEAQVDNGLLMRALAIAARCAGAELRERTTVRDLLIRKRAVQGVATDRGSIAAGRVVNCLGSWAAMGGAFPVALPIEPIRGQILTFHGPPRLFRHAVMSDQAYAVQRRDGRLITGSTLERAGFEKALTLSGIHKIACGLRHISRSLNGLPFLEAWSGLRPCTRDRLPILGSTPIEGLFIATGHFRHGILLAPITASAMASLLLGQRPSADLAPFSPARFLSR